ncbi:rRNA pseudouridine synthase [Candidatus Gracilibacteria bacterium]|nr:rRNA pseudouridine synthase [Candidatus Gracilibacteria bacterium]
MPEKIRLQKYMSQAGICSRRKAEEYIAAGQVIVNGAVAQIGQSVDPESDQVELGDQAVKQQSKYVYYKFHKPRGIETTCAQRDGQSIIDIMDVPERVFPIGRLDKESTGLIIMSNDGRITNYLTHPRYEHEKQYVVEVFGPIHDRQLQSMSEGMFILGSKTKPAKVERMSSGTFSITLTEGKNRQIRRMVEKLGGKVKKLKRIRVENIELGNLPVGAYKKLTASEKNELFERLDIENYTE